MIELVLGTALCLGWPGTQEPSVQEPQQEESPADETPTDPVDAARDTVTATDGVPSFDHAFGPDEIAASMAGWVAANEDLVRIESIGGSRGGRDIQVATLTDPNTGPASSKPGLLFVDYSRGADVSGAEAILALGWRLVERAQDDPVLAQILAEATIYLAPAWDPDARTDPRERTAAETRYDLNFPLGWQPETIRPGSGPYPLARNATLEAVRFLEARANLVLIVGVVPRENPGGEPWSGADFPEEDRRVLQVLCDEVSQEGSGLRPWGALGSEGGGLFDYAYQALGIYAVAWEGPAAATERGAWLEGVQRGMTELLRRLPQVRIEADHVEEIAPGLWQLDVAVRNAGVVPTLSVLGGRRGVPGDLRFTVNGMRLLATAGRAAEGEPFQAGRLLANGEEILLSGGSLDGGEVRWLRLVLEGTAGSSVGVRGASPRAGKSELVLDLR